MFQGGPMPQKTSSKNLSNSDEESPLALPLLQEDNGEGNDSEAETSSWYVCPRVTPEFTNLLMDGVMGASRYLWPASLTVTTGSYTEPYAEYEYSEYIKCSEYGEYEKAPVSTYAERSINDNDRAKFHTYTPHPTDHNIADTDGSLQISSATETTDFRIASSIAWRGGLGTHFHVLPGENILVSRNSDVPPSMFVSMTMPVFPSKLRGYTSPDPLNLISPQLPSCGGFGSNNVIVVWKNKDKNKYSEKNNLDSNNSGLRFCRFRSNFFSSANNIVDTEQQTWGWEPKLAAFSPKFFLTNPEIIQQMSPSTPSSLSFGITKDFAG